MEKNILITGATSGLGLMLTRFFDKKNYGLFITGKDKIKINEIKKIFLYLIKIIVLHLIFKIIKIYLIFLGL